MRQALKVTAFGVLRLRVVAGWLWLEFQHTVLRNNWILVTCFNFLK
jgi:hypothetical protein